MERANMLISSQLQDSTPRRVFRNRATEERLRQVDYLFLAFNTSTAFSPTDALVLARWAKILMMLQSLLSLLIIALLAARAVNIL